MQDVFRRFSPDVVFHTAAHKHVPLMEFDSDEAVLNNVGGTKTLAETALGNDVERFVNISTDKAVNPSSMVGATKRIAEYVVHAISEEARPDWAFVSVRFGNVLGSRGSVVPVFQEQIRKGGHNDDPAVGGDASLPQDAVAGDGR
jgi:FlaA1/EpsC-like NDP-sugar epimerase